MRYEIISNTGKSFPGRETRNENRGREGKDEDGLEVIEAKLVLLRRPNSPG
ncbi:MAG: hypothetical protein SF339_11945 [Blastocatellia bacterium]|nr:hypothetical protein [Blastocatellia bacterium]